MTRASASIAAPASAGDAVFFLVSPKKSRKGVDVGLAAPRISSFFNNPLLVASGDRNVVTVLAGEAEQGRDLNRDGDLDDQVTMDVRVQNGKTRLADSTPHAAGAYGGP